MQTAPSVHVWQATPAPGERERGRRARGWCMFGDGETVGRKLVALCAGLAVMTGVTGCGDDGVPGSAVATVDGEPIERQSFDHWLTIAAKSGGGPKATVPAPPDYANCKKPKSECAAD